jgi:glutaredoxin 3
LLDENKVAYKDLDVATDKSARDEMVNKTGRLAVPVVDIDGEVSVGYDEKWLKQKLNLS